MKTIDEIRKEDILAENKNTMFVRNGDANYPIIFLTYNKFTKEITKKCIVSKEILIKMFKELE